MLRRTIVLGRLAPLGIRPQHSHSCTLFRSLSVKAAKRAAEVVDTEIKKAPKRRAAKKAEPENRDIPRHASGPQHIDLQHGRPAGGHWAKVQRWVLFSDLHVSYKTLDVCCEVLDRVKQEAAARNAGILFLGARLSCPDISWYMRSV